MCCDSTHLRDVIKETEFSQYYVDVEYNRNNGKIKTIVDDNSQVITINCDIIVHSRGERAKDNLLAIEVKKKSSSVQEKDKDKNRLIALTKNTYDDIWSYDGISFPEHVCCYDLGIFYEIDKNSKKIELEYYINGKMVNKHNFSIY